MPSTIPYAFFISHQGYLTSIGCLKLAAAVCGMSYDAFHALGIIAAQVLFFELKLVIDALELDSASNKVVKEKAK
jgi:hypothetical protein